jgi:hypothetical protein
MSLTRAIYVGIAAIFALAVWFVAKSGDPSKPERKEKTSKVPPTRQQELFEARNRIRRQIEVLKTSPHAYGLGAPSLGAPSRDALNELESLLRDIEEELKIFGPH